MSKKRRKYSPQFKSKVALEAIQGVKTVPELSSQHNVVDYRNSGHEESDYSGKAGHYEN